MERTRSIPCPTRRSRGTIFLSRASTSPVIPSSLGTENPQMSASSTPTVSPRRARATARLTVTELFPTPPLPEATAITRAVSGMSVTGAGFWASCRARAMTALRWSASITPVSTETVRTPGTAPTWVSTSLRIWVRSGHPATVRATSTATSPPSPTRTPLTMPSSTMSAPSSGSTTPRRAARTAASVTAAPPVGARLSGWGASDLLTWAILPVGTRGPPDGLYHPPADAGTLVDNASRWAGGDVPGPVAATGRSRAPPSGEESTAIETAIEEERR